MDQADILSALIGLGLAAANVLVSLAILRRAGKLPGARFMKRVVLSLALRMLAILVLLVLILTLTPIRQAPFGMAFVAGVAVGIAVEMWILLRWHRSTG